MDIDPHDRLGHLTAQFQQRRCQTRLLTERPAMRDPIILRPRPLSAPGTKASERFFCRNQATTQRLQRPAV